LVKHEQSVKLEESLVESFRENSSVGVLLQNPSEPIKAIVDPRKQIVILL
jgi:hypothetical protein